MISEMIESAGVNIGLFSPPFQWGNTKNSKKTWMSSLENHKKWYYLPTPPLGQDMTQGQFLSGV